MDQTAWSEINDSKLSSPQKFIYVWTCLFDYWAFIGQQNIFWYSRLESIYANDSGLDKWKLNDGKRCTTHGSVFGLMKQKYKQKYLVDIILQFFSAAKNQIRYNRLKMWFFYNPCIVNYLAIFKSIRITITPTAKLFQNCTFQRNYIIICHNKLFSWISVF